jgi:hypothetical protein
LSARKQKSPISLGWTTSACSTEKCDAIIKSYCLMYICFMFLCTRWSQISVAPATRIDFPLREQTKEKKRDEGVASQQACADALLCPALFSARPDTHHVTYSNGVTHAPAIPFAFSHHLQNNRSQFSVTIGEFPRLYSLQVGFCIL